VEAIPKYLALLGTWGRQTYMSSGERSEDHDPSCGPDRTPRLTENKGEALENPVPTRVDSLSDNYMAG
jgi:hypothetical protein